MLSPKTSVLGDRSIGVDAQAINGKVRLAGTVEARGEDAIGARFRERVAKARADNQMRQDGQFLSKEDRRALDIMGLPIDADRKALRTRYTELLRRYHPDHNGGDRTHETQLQGVIEAYGHLRKAAVFG